MRASSFGGDIIGIKRFIVGYFKIKTSSYHHKNSLYKFQTVVRPSYLYNGKPFSDKTTFILNWPIGLVLYN